MYIKKFTSLMIYLKLKRLYHYRLLECGHHECDMVCHAGDCKTCETLPEVVTSCPCGATPLTDLSTEIRTSCTDPIPTCGQICNKPLGCGSPGNVNINGTMFPYC